MPCGSCFKWALSLPLCHPISLLEQRLCLRRDKCSIKRSVLGPMCKLGSNVKIINCVLMDSVIVHDGCHLQNCIICTGAELQARSISMASPVLKLTPSEQDIPQAAFVR